MTQEPNPDQTLGPSLVERLRSRFGSEIDPGITLDQPSRSAPNEVSPSSQPMPSSGVLSRLESRGLATTRYRLDGEIARGGMGAILEVWDEDLRRHLAMKVALSSRGEGSTATPENLDARVLARFLEEAQVTGQLEHPGIVPVHELGLDESGQLYFTMPLVRGRDLEAIFGLVARGEESWSTTRALGVLLKACEAMAYAHDKGVIHRDLKPANVMVGRFGEVYVMDWGLARVRGHEDRHDMRVAPVASAGEPGAEAPVAPEPRANAQGESNAALYTMDGDVIGTPAFMAPEQARGQLEALDERTDVYSVGAMLYRLLTGTAPYVPPGEVRNALDILTELLLGPPQPIEQLAPETPGELVAICEKAMAREPGERYRDMSELAEDLRAYLENRVVRAYEAGAVAEARKWVRRNKPLALSLAAGMLALVGGLAMTLVLKQRSDENATLAEERRLVADRSAEVAKEQRALAEESAQLAEESRLAAEESARLANRQVRVNKKVNEFLNQALFAPADSSIFGRDVKVRDVLSSAVVALEFQFEEEPDIEAELRLTLSNSFASLGEYEQARNQARRAVELIEGGSSDHSDMHLRSMVALGDALNYCGEYDEAVQTLERATELALELFEEPHRSIRTSRNELALAYGNVGRLQEARDLYESILERYPVESERGNPDVGSTQGNYGVILWQQGEYDEAEQALTKAIEVRTEEVRKDDQLLLQMQNNLALVYQDQGRLRESEKLFREVAKLQPKAFGPKHPDTGRTLSNLAVVYMDQGRYRKAERTLDDAFEILVEAVGEEHPETLRVIHNLAACYAYQERFDEALELREANLEKYERVLGLRDELTLNMMNSLAVLYLDLGRFEEAEAKYRETLELQREVLGPDHPTTLITLENLGGVLYRTERYEESRELVLRVLEARERVLGPDHPAVGKTIYNLGMNDLSVGDTEQAIARFEEALALLRAAHGDVHPNIAEFLQQLGDVQLDEEHFEESARNYLEAIRVRRELGPDDRYVGYMLHQVGYAYFELEDYERAIPVLEEGLAVRTDVHGELGRETLLTGFVLARCLLGAGRPAEAEPLVVRFYEAQLEVLGPDHREIQASLRLLEKIANAQEE